MQHSSIETNSRTRWAAVVRMPPRILWCHSRIRWRGGSDPAFSWKLLDKLCHTTALTQKLCLKTCWKSSGKMETLIRTLMTCSMRWSPIWIGRTRKMLIILNRYVSMKTNFWSIQRASRILKNWLFISRQSLPKLTAVCHRTSYQSQTKSSKLEYSWKRTKRK